MARASMPGPVARSLPIVTVMDVSYCQNTPAAAWRPGHLSRGSSSPGLSGRNRQVRVSRARRYRHLKFYILADHSAQKSVHALDGNIKSIFFGAMTCFLPNARSPCVSDAARWAALSIESVYVRSGVICSRTAIEEGFRSR